jgi:predicted HTH transcriptional regulator
MLASGRHLGAMTEYPFLDPPHMRSADSWPVRMTTLDMIDMQRVAAHVADAVKRGRYLGPTEPLEYLLGKRCVVDVEGEMYPTLAGILCFGHNPQQLFPNAVVDLGHYKGTEPLSIDVVHLQKNIGGSIFEQIDWVEQYLSRNTRHGMTVSNSGSRRVELHEYPPVVIRELNVNMLAHRDYTMSGSASRVMLFRGRAEWASPGGLPPGVTEENLLSIQNARNPVLLSILYEAGYVEAYGMGLDTVVRVLSDEGMSAPQFRDLVGAAFIVTVHGRQLDTREQEPYVSLSDAQRKIIRLVSANAEVSLADIREAFPDRAKRTLQEDITVLIEAKILERHGQTKATRYRMRDQDQAINNGDGSRS